MASSGSSASLAVDGDDLTVWESAAGGDQWLYVDLGATYSFNLITVRWGQLYATDYQFEVSVDALNWQPMWGVTGGGPTESRAVVATRRYVRVHLSAGIDPGRYQLRSLEVYGAATPTPTRTATPTATRTPTTIATSTITPTPTATVTATPGQQGQGMTIYRVSNYHAQDIVVTHTITNGLGFTHQFTDTVPGGLDRWYHVRDMPQVPSPFSGSLLLVSDQSFNAALDGFDYP